MSGTYCRETAPKCTSGNNCENNKIPMCFPNRECENPLPECPVCDEEGQTFAHPLNCDWFYKCQGKLAVPMKCGCGFLYNVKHNVCDYPCNVDCKNRVRRATQLKMFCQGIETKAFGQRTPNNKCG
jgi:hypothetical protein